MSSEEPTTNTNKTRTIIRRVVKKENSSFISKHWQAGLVVVSLAVSGLVAYKVFFPRKKKEQDQMQQLIAHQQQQIQQLQQQMPHQELVASDPSQFVTMPLINGNGGSNGNGHHLGNLPLIPIDLSQTKQRPAISSWAEKLIQRDQFKNIPMINTPVDMPMMSPPPQPQQQPHQHIHQQQQQYGHPSIPSAPPLQRPPMPGQNVSNEDIL